MDRTGVDDCGECVYCCSSKLEDVDVLKDVLGLFVTGSSKLSDFDFDLLRRVTIRGRLSFPLRLTVCSYTQATPLFKHRSQVFVPSPLQRDFIDLHSKQAFVDLVGFFSLSILFLLLSLSSMQRRTDRLDSVNPRNEVGIYKR